MKTPFLFVLMLVSALLLAVSCRDNTDDSGKYPSIDSSLCAGFAEGTTREHYGKDKPQFCDARDGQKYVYVEIGGQTWMAENLNYNASGSKCFGQDGAVWNEETYENDTITPEEVQANCETYGRLYNWAAALAVCPSGWHLPTGAEWDALVKFIDPDYDIEEPLAIYNMFYTTAGAKLKIEPGWNRGSLSSRPSTDDYGFSALPGGYGFDTGVFSYAGSKSELWSATEVDYDTRYAISRFIGDGNNVPQGSGQKTWLYSVRCLKD